MSTDAAAQYIREAQALLDQALTELNAAPPDPGPDPVAITTPEAFDAALAAAAPGGTITCATSLVYTKGLTLTKPVRIVSERVGEARMTKDEPAPKFTGGVKVKADDVELVGLEVRHPDAGVSIIELTGLHPWLDRLRVLGDPTNGSKRGIQTDGGAMTIARCFIDDIKRKGQDSQAISGYSFAAPGLLIDNCWLCAAGQSVMFGGDRAHTEIAIPSEVVMKNCDCTKQQKWLTEGWQIKCALEAKNVKGWTIRDCTAQWAGTSDGQAGYIFVITPRNQYGDEPFTVVKDVLVENVHARYGCGCISFMGTDSNATSQVTTNVVFKNVQFDAIDKLGPCKMSQAQGAGRMFLFQRAPVGITLEAITVNGQNIDASGYFIKEGAPPPTKLVMRNLKLAASKYGWKIDAGGQGESALKAYCPDIVYEVSATDAGAVNVPPLPV
jgi:hypothetical protein